MTITVAEMKKMIAEAEAKGYDAVNVYATFGGYRGDVLDYISFDGSIDESHSGDTIFEKQIYL